MNDSMILGNELGRIWKQASVVFLPKPSQFLPRTALENEEPRSGNSACRWGSKPSTSRKNE
jgi:hypothetical protein